MNTFLASLKAKLSKCWFFVRYTDKLPSWQAGNARLFLITIRNTKVHDIGILEHEKCHVKQWWVLFLLMSVIGWPALYFFYTDPVLMIVSAAIVGLAPALHPFLYLLVRPYRQWAEVQAYRIQIERGGYSDNRFAIRALMNPKYRLKLTESKAAALLGL